MIEVVTKYTVDDMVKFQRFHFIFGGLKAHLLRAGLIGAAVAVLFLLNILNDALSLFLAVLLLFVWFVYLLPTFSAAQMFKREPRLADTTLAFTFNEDGFTAASSGGRIDGTSEMKYADLVKARESKSFFYLYISKGQAYVINKSRFAPGDANRLGKLLEQAMPNGKFRAVRW